MKNLSSVLLLILGILLTQGTLIYLYSCCQKYFKGVPLKSALNPFEKYTDYYPHPEWVKGYNAHKQEMGKAFSEYLDKLEQQHEQLNAPMDLAKKWCEDERHLN
jgi:hypothetical protein